MQTPPNDDELNSFPDLEALKAGDEAAWAKAFCRLWPIAMRAARTPKAALTETEAEDAAIEALSLVAAQRAQITTAERLEALTFVIAQRRAISLARAKSADKRGAPTLSLDQLSEQGVTEAEPSAPCAESGIEMEMAELAVLLRRAMSVLGEQERTMLLEAAIEECTHKELSRRHGMPLGTVGPKMMHALRKIRRQLEKSPALLQELKVFLR